MSKDLMETLKERDLIEQVTSQDLAEILKSSPRRVYLGIDPTADALHIGHLTGVMVMAWFQRFGHTPIFILGGATAQIGDPSGKSKERNLLSDAEVQSNLEKLKMNLVSLIDLENQTTHPIFLNNADWIKKFSVIDFLRDVGKYFRVGAMLSKEAVRLRLESEEGISFTEFAYQLFQAYDFKYLNEQYKTEFEIGGSDQWGNITAGIDLIRKTSGNSAWGLTFPLLTTADGKKFGKTESGTIWLSSDKISAFDLYQSLLRVSDQDVIKMLKRLTFIPIEEIRAWQKDLEVGKLEPNFCQKKLALEIVERVHGKKGIEEALHTTSAFAPGSTMELTEKNLEALSKQIDTLPLTKADFVGCKFVDVAAKTSLFPSRGEITRAVQNGGVYLNEKKVDSPAQILSESDLISGRFAVIGYGKKKKIVIEIFKNLA